MEKIASELLVELAPGPLRRTRGALVDRAVRTSAYKMVSHITFPVDLQIADPGANPWEGTAPARTPDTAPFFAEPKRPTP